MGPEGSSRANKSPPTIFIVNQANSVHTIPSPQIH
jgi:hypothetical protein